MTAAVVLAPNSSLTSEDIFKIVEKRLEDYKHLRGGVHFMKKLPRNPQGKIVRKRLRQLIVATA